MDTRESKTAWIVAGILFVLLIIVGWLWLAQKQDLNSVLQNGKTDIASVRVQMQKDCQGPEADDSACAQDKKDLSALLEDFKADIMESSTTTAQ